MQTNAAEKPSTPDLPGLELRRATNDDRDGIVQLHSEGLAELGVAHDPKLDSDLEDVEGSYLKRGGEFFVALKGEKVVGMGAFRKLDSRNVELRRIRVARAESRQGIARAIVQSLVQEAAKREFKSIVLDLSGEMTAAKQLFESEGFELERDGEFFGVETFFYRKPL